MNISEQIKEKFANSNFKKKMDQVKQNGLKTQQEGMAVQKQGNAIQSKMEYQPIQSNKSKFDIKNFFSNWENIEIIGGVAMILAIIGISIAMSK